MSLFKLPCIKGLGLVFITGQYSGILRDRKVSEVAYGCGLKLLEGIVARIFRLLKFSHKNKYKIFWLEQKLQTTGDDYYLAKQ